MGSAAARRNLMDRVLANVVRRAGNVRVRVPSIAAAHNEEDGVMSPGLLTIMAALIVGVAIGASAAGFYFKIPVSRTWQMPDGMKVTVRGPLATSVTLPDYNLQEQR